MPIETRRTTGPNLWLGICLVLGGVGMTLESMHLIQPGFIRQYWPLGLVIIGAGLVADSFFKPHSDADAGARRSSPFLILAVLCGFLLLSQAFERGAEKVPESADGSVKIYSVMGGGQTVSHATRFPGGNIKCLMGGAELDLRQTSIPRGESATVDVTAVMGGAVIRVPRDWIVDTKTLAVMGGIDDQRPRSTRTQADATADSGPAPPRLIIRGDLIMGGLVIKY